MKDVLNNLRKIDRLNAVGVNYTHSGIKDHLYMVTSLRSNFLPQDVTLAALQKYGKRQERERARRGGEMRWMKVTNGYTDDKSME